MILSPFRMLFAAALLLACRTDAADATRSRAAAAPPITLRPVVTGVQNAIGLTHAGDSSGRLFIVSQNGRIIVFDGTRLLSQPFLDIDPLVACCGEQGLLGLAFHPQYETNGFFFVNYTDNSGDTVVARYRVSPSDPNVADPNSASVILQVDQPFANHNGGQLQFGPDGMLYVGMGDGGSGGDPGNRAQNLNELLGKLLRIDVDHGLPYTVPADNPFVGMSGRRGEIWAYGLRNPWRFTFDRATGDLFIADVGQNQFEEINWTPASSRGGENYGWRLMEANHCFNPSSNCNDGSLTLPVLEYGRSDGCSVTGGYRYRGGIYPSLQGVYFYGDLCTGTIWGATRGADGAWQTTELFESQLTITSFGEDEGGEVYVVGYNGTIFRIEGPALERRRPARR
jgi:glucose/arabinose dehydrogenase